MSTKWKNNVFSNRINTEIPNTSQTQDIYKDFNYKQIPPLHNVLVEDVDSDDESESDNVEPFQEGIIDTSALDEDDVVDKVEKNRNQIIIEDTTEKTENTPNVSNQKKKRSKKSNISEDATQNIDEIKELIKQIETKGKSMKGKNFNFEKMYELLALIIGLPAKVVDKTVDLVGALYVDLVNKMQGKSKLSNKEKPYKDLVKVGRTQLKNLVAILISFWIVLNWWYVFNYHHSYFSFAKMFDMEGVKIFFESLLMFTNVVNYLLIGIKQDSRVPFIEYVNKFLWDWRPIVFVIFYTTLQSIYATHNMSIEKKFTDAMARKTNDLSGANTGLFLISFVKMDLANRTRMLERMMIFQNIFIVGFVILLKLLFLMAFLPLGILFLYLFLVFHSFFALPVFAGTSILTSLNAMFADLKNSVPDADGTTPESPVETIMRYVLNMSFPVGLVITILSVLISNISIVYKVAGGNSLKMAMGTISIIVLIIGAIIGGLYIYGSRPITYS